MTEIKYISFDTIDSTNKYAKELVQKDVNLALGTVVTAKTQTAGKGRLGRSFYSPKDCGIYMSAILVPQYKITNPALITCITAVVVKNVLCDFFNIQDDLKIKWVNDLYLGNKKICGILTEGLFGTKERNTQSQIESVIIGIGINIFSSDFPLEIKNKAGAILDNQYFNSKLILQIQKAISERLFFVLDVSPDQIQKNFESLMDEYRKSLFLKGRKVLFSPVIGDTSKDYFATILDVSPTAELIVKTEDNQIKNLCSGEISISNEFQTNS